MPSLDTAVAESEGYTGSSFDLESYLARSKQLDISDIDFSRVADHPVSEEEVRCLVYMMDIESHTLCYMQEVLNAGAASDPEIADFLGCWVYEEAYHGRAIERWLRAAGVERGPNVCSRRPLSLGDRFQALGSKILYTALPRDFVTVYMAWGAINEHSTLFGYTNLARKTRNPILAELLRRIARDESRHFGFYYYKAFSGLKDNPFRQRLVGTMMRLFWTPVGEGVKPGTETDFLISYIFGDPEGRDALARIDRTMSRLPGFEWFDLMVRRSERSFRNKAQGLIPAVAAA